MKNICRKRKKCLIKRAKQIKILLKADLSYNEITSQIQKK